MSTTAHGPEAPEPANSAAKPHAAPEKVSLTPTESLLMDLMVAQHRLGWTMQQVPTIHRRALRRLAVLGLIGHDHGNVDKCDKAWLTEAGMVFAMDPTLLPPALGPTCRSFYMGPLTNDSRVDCDRRNHHNGKHRAHWYKAKKGSADPVRIVKATVKWSDDEACGYASDRYGEELRAHDNTRAARFAAARARFGIETPNPEDDPQF